MTDLPAIFSGPMVRGLWEGRKTNTRRFAWIDRGAVSIDYGKQLAAKGWKIEPRNGSHSYAWRPSPWQKIAVGDRLWVRESFRPDDVAPDDSDRTIWRADATADALRETKGIIKWKPAIHMPRERSRLTLIVTGQKIEPLWNISEIDCRFEGVEYETADPGFYYVPGIHPHNLTAVGVEERADLMPHAVQCFRKLWIYINGREAWESNPFVVAVSFRVIKANIDAKEARAA